MQKQCLCCGNSFEAKRSFAKYCSDACKTKYLLKQKAGKRICAECGATFYPSTPKIRFCSTSCGSKATHRTAIKLVICSICSKEFQFKGTTTPKYCPECRKKVHSEHVKNWRESKGVLKDRGVGSGRWQRTGDNSTKRHFSGVVNREKEYRQVCALKFGDFKRCVICLSEHNIHVHHIDHDLNNNDYDNLTYLCAKCHRNHHANGSPSQQEIITATKKFAT